MKKNEIFEFTAPNRVVVTAVAIAQINVLFDPETYYETILGYEWLCYAQNRLFTVIVSEVTDIQEGKILVEYCIIPYCDSLLEAYHHELDVADDYASREY